LNDIIADHKLFIEHALSLNNKAAQIESKTNSMKKLSFLQDGMPEDCELNCINRKSSESGRWELGQRVEMQIINDLHSIGEPRLSSRRINSGVIHPGACHQSAGANIRSVNTMEFRDDMKSG
jgi:hypothetical protein